MAREIKFRAWDGNEMNKVYQLCFDDFGGLLGCYVKYPTDDGNYRSFKEGLKILQYTGLKDKKGKEIYEGDILATSNEDPGGWKKEEEAYTVTVWSESDYPGITFSTWFPTDDQTSIYSWQYIEVIGNIYENPELLVNE